MMKKIVMKFGGSLFTDKDTIPLSVKELMENAEKYIKYENITGVAKETLDAVRYHRDISFLWLIHGVGPFGHFLIKDDRWKEVGSIKKTHEYCEFFNSVVIHQFREVGLPVTPIHPIETCHSTGTKFDITKLYEQGLDLVKNRRIPFTYGDIVPSQNEFKVLSGDDTAVYLAEKLKASIIMVTDVDVSDKDPKKFGDAKIIKEISKDEVITLRDEGRIDVSGGIYGKIRKLQEAAKKGIFCQIINGTKEGNVYDALMGNENIGTKIV
jgi:isopentenyl phosphate kinase